MWNMNDALKFIRVLVVQIAVNVCIYLVIVSVYIDMLSDTCSTAFMADSSGLLYSLYFED